MSESTLFLDAEIAAKARLLDSGLGRLLPGEKVTDLFCGAGGWLAVASASLGIKVDFAVNHSPLAIEFHKANNPGCVHHQGDAWKARPRDVIGQDSTLGLLLASAACTTHSSARGSAPISPRIHMLGWCIARWIKEAGPRIVLVENVPEWREWGPTRYKLIAGHRVRGADGKLIREVDPDRKGKHFLRWVRFCKRLGYSVEWRVLNAADFGAASRRKRLFVQMRCDGAPIVWPEATHASKLENLDNTFCSRERNRCEECRSESDPRSASGACTCADRDAVGISREKHSARDRSYQRVGTLVRHRSAADIIDWSDLGTSIFERTRPLKDKTLARIAEGIRRFVINDPAPFIVRVTHGDGQGWKVSPADGPLPTQTTRQDLSVCSPVLAKHYGGVVGTRIDEPTGTITPIDHHSLVTPVLVQQNHGDHQSQRIDETLRTCTTQSNRHTLIAPLLQRFGGNGIATPGDQPIPTITAGNGPGRGAGAGHALGLISPLIATVGWGERDGQSPRCQSIGQPINTIPAGGVKGGVVAPALVHLNRHTQPTRADEPIHTVTSGGMHAGLVAAFMVQYYRSAKSNNSKPDVPLPCVVTHDRHGLVIVKLDGEPYVIVDILFRMLRTHELAAAMGFPASYLWPKSQRAAVQLIGNAVSPVMAEALLGASLPEHVGGGVVNASKRRAS